MTLVIIIVICIISTALNSILVVNKLSDIIIFMMFPYRQLLFDYTICSFYIIIAIMRTNQKDQHHLRPNQGHQCHTCKDNQVIISKYRNLIQLLYKKIKKLQRKCRGQVTMKSIMDSKLQIETIQNIQVQINNKNLSLVCVPSVCQENAKIQDIPVKEESRTIQKQNECTETKTSSSGFYREMGHLQKVGFVINGLTEEVMQLKSNFMHVRHCLYALYKEANMTDKINGSPIALNITLALMNIFQFSEAERDEMFSNKKVKLRKKHLNSNKENIFVTVKQI